MAKILSPIRSGRNLPRSSNSGVVTIMILPFH